MMRMPMPAVEPLPTVVPASVISVTAPVIAVPGTNDDAKNRQRRSVYDRARRRWWRVIVSRRWRAVRLNHFSARIRTHSRPKPECECCQCYHENFSSHNLLSLPVSWRVSWRIEPDNQCEVAEENQKQEGEMGAVNYRRTPASFSISV